MHLTRPFLQPQHQNPTKNLRNPYSKLSTQQGANASDIPGHSSTKITLFGADLWGGTRETPRHCRDPPLTRPCLSLALQDLPLPGQGGGGRDGGAESPGGSAHRQDHCQRVFAFLPAQGKRSVHDATPAGPAQHQGLQIMINSVIKPAKMRPEWSGLQGSISGLSIHPVQSWRCRDLGVLH